MVSLKFLLRSRARKKCLHSDYSKDTMEKMRRKRNLVMRLLKMLKSFLRKFYQDQKTERHVYHDRFIKVKGKLYKNKRLLMESMHKFIRERKFATSEKRLAQGPEGEKVAPGPAPAPQHVLLLSWSSVK